MSRQNTSFLTVAAALAMTMNALGGDGLTAAGPRVTHEATADRTAAKKSPTQRGSWAKQVAPADQVTGTAAESSVVAGVANDACVNATAISGTGTFSFNSTNNTLDGAPACTGHTSQQIDRDEWFCWTAPQTVCNGQYVVSTCGGTSTVDTAIAVYQGCNCNNTTPLACGDDDCGLQSHVPFTATPGATYLIRIGTYPDSVGGPGSFSIACRPPLPCSQPGANCQSPASVAVVQSSRGNFVVADDFTPAQSGNVSGVCWWGTYLDTAQNDCQGTAPDSFQVKYYASDNGSPGALLATYSQSNGTLNVSGPAPTGVLIVDDLAQYEYSATHAALPVSAGQCYWIEITNSMQGCSWFWEVGINRNQRAFQDGLGSTQGVYEPSEAILDDMAFCLNRGLGNADNCLPPPPENNNCANASAVNAAGEYFYDLAGATDDGPAHSACLVANQSQIGNDIWYCLTAPCSGDIFVRTCEDSAVDTRLAAYEGCACPPTSLNLLECNDDLCGQEGLQSMIRFEAVQGQQYLIRAGTYPGSPGGPGVLDITCGPPDNAACPATGGCCDASDNEPGCSNETCCESVCACDPFCCEVVWDTGCATTGFDGRGCGAANLCACAASCGDPDAGDCCLPHGNPSCSDAACCDAVCACDPFCCETEWDNACAGFGFQDNGCGATALCEACIPNCPAGEVVYVNPASGVVDARRPHPPTNAGAIEGFAEFAVAGPEGITRGCFSMCETASTGSTNFVAQMIDEVGSYSVILDRPITPGALSKIRYRADNATIIAGTFIAHPGNVNGDTVTNTNDVTALLIALNGGPSAHGLASTDLDRSGMRTPLDILTLMDLLNGGQAFTPWLNTARPAPNAQCP